MTEAEWLASDDPQAMLDAIHQMILYGESVGGPKRDRKLRLFACACIRLRLGSHVTTDAEIDRYEELGHTSSDLSDLQWAENWARNETGYQKKSGSVRAALLRDIFGNPFRPVVSLCGNTSHRLLAGKTICVCDRCQTILNPTVLSLARGVYDDRAFDRMPVLADALEEAGCAEELLLRHLRSKEQCFRCFNDGHGGPPSDHEKSYCSYCDRTQWAPLRGSHVRGCWVLDLILWK